MNTNGPRYNLILTIYPDRTPIHKETLGVQEYLVGKSPACDIVIANHNVAEKHCKICVAEDGSISVEDLGSVSGTRIDDQYIERRRAQRIHPGQILTLGFQTKLKLERQVEIPRTQVEL